MKEIQEHKIKIYEFPDTEDEEDNKLIRKIKVSDHTFIFLKTCLEELWLLSAGWQINWDGIITV